MKNFEIKRILVPIDFSSNSKDALKSAVLLAAQHQACLELFYVFDTDNNLYPESHISNRFRNPGETIKAMNELKDSITKTNGMSCSIAHTNGTITSAIIQRSIESNSDLIVMGKNGHSGNREGYAGMHSYDVIKKSQCPILIVPAGKGNKSFKNVLFPVRSVLSVLEKYNIVKPILQNNQGSLHLVGMRNPVYISELHIISRLMGLLKSNADQDGIDTKITYYFNDDQFAGHVLETVKDSGYKFDLAVITAELDDTMRDYYIGNYTQDIIHKTSVPLLIIRPSSSPLPKTQVLKALEEGTAIF